MKKSPILLLGIAAFAAAAPTAAFARGSFSITIGTGYGYPGYGYGGYGDSHQREHEDINDGHADIHDQLDEEHERAHEQGLDPWEHRQVHRYLRREHRSADRELSREHNQWHGQGYWNNGYDGYYGDFRGYGNDGY